MDVWGSLFARAVPFVAGLLTTYGVAEGHAEAIAFGIAAAAASILEVIARRNKTAK